MAEETEAPPPYQPHDVGDEDCPGCRAFEALSGVYGLIQPQDLAGFTHALIDVAGAVIAYNAKAEHLVGLTDRTAQRLRDAVAYQLAEKAKEDEETVQ